MSFRASSRSIIYALAVLFLALGGACTAYSQYTTASLGGTVSDPSGATIADAKVSVQNLETGLQKTTQTGSRGTFSFTAMPVGRYQIVVEKQGFTRFVESGITLVLDETANVPVQLSVGNLSQEVTISADAELLNTQSGTAGQLIDQRRIVDLPLDEQLHPQIKVLISIGEPLPPTRLIFPLPPAPPLAGRPWRLPASACSSRVI